MKVYNLTVLLLSLTILAFEFTDVTAKSEFDDWFYKCEHYEDFVDLNGYFKKCISLEPDSNELTKAVAREVTESPFVLLKEYHRLQKASQIKRQFRQDMKSVCSKPRGDHVDITKIVKYFWNAKKQYTILESTKDLKKVCESVKEATENNWIFKTNIAMLIQKVADDSEMAKDTVCTAVEKHKSTCTGLWFFQNLQLCSVWSMQATLIRDCQAKYLPFSTTKFLRTVVNNPPFEGTPYTAHEFGQQNKSSSSWATDFEETKSLGAVIGTIPYKTLVLLTCLQLYIFMNCNRT